MLCVKLPFEDTDSTAKEYVMINRVLKNAKDFYKDPKNIQAFEAWLKDKEKTNHGTNHSKH